MDVLQRIFSSKEQFFEKTFNNEIKPKDAIFFFVDHVNKIENLALQPLVESNDEMEIRSISILNYLAKTINYIDMFLCNKLNHNKKNSKPENKQPHYWNYIVSSFYNVESVKFIQIFYGEKYDINKLALIWLCLVLLDRSFYDFILDFYKLDLDKKFYHLDSIIIEQRNEILEISKRLSNIHILITFNIFNEYMNFKIKRKQEIDDQIDITHVSSSLRKSMHPQISTNINNEYLLKQNSNFYPIKSSEFNSQGFNLNSNHAFQSLLSKREQQSNFINSKDDIDNLLNLIQKNEENNNYTYKKFESGDQIDDIREKNINSKVKVILITPGGKNSDGSNILQENQIDYNITKKADLSIKENHFNFNFEVKSTISQNMNNYHKNIFSNKNFEIHRRYDQHKYTKRDTIKLGKKEVKLTNSILFFLNHFYNKQPFHEFHKKLLSKPLTLEDQNNQCQYCLKRFESYLTIPSDKIFWCSYFMRYVCDDCFADDYSVIPLFIIKFWDFSKFPICSKAKEIITEWYDKPVINIKSSDFILSKSGKMKRSIVLKRKLHRIFDYLKCESAESFALQTLGNYKYLVLLENLFSLKDLCEINEGIFESKLHEFLTLFENHIFVDCKICEYKGRTCMVCNNGEKLMIYDVENVFHCKYCNTINHKNCSMVHNCLIDN